MDYSMIAVEAFAAKSACTIEILEKLPEWFGDKQAINNYVEIVQKLSYWAALDQENRGIGFLAVKIHYNHTGEQEKDQRSYIHLIFSERRLLAEPDVKIVTRSVSVTRTESARSRLCQLREQGSQRNRAEAENKIF